MTERSPLLGTARASMAAGPVFLSAAALQSLYAVLPAPIEITAAGLLTFLALLIPAFVAGFMLAFVPSIVGSLVMDRLSRWHDLARLPAAWTLAGAAGGIGLGLVFRADADFLFPLGATGAVCARICRAYAAFG